MTASPENQTRRYLATLSVAALGVVYGDIGTSPLYALKECFFGPHAMAPTPGNVLGVLSLIFWSLVLVVSVKYLAFVLSADNRGEGGILALMALTHPGGGPGRRPRYVVLLLGLFGAALLYGDGVITPAISVLGAVEGLTVAQPGLASWVTRGFCACPYARGTNSSATSISHKVFANTVLIITSLLRGSSN